MTYSIVEVRKEYVTTHRIGIAYQHLSRVDVVVDIIASWLKSYGITPPNRELLTEFVTFKRNGKRLEYYKGNLVMFESKDAGWIIDYEEKPPSKSIRVLNVDQSAFENYLFENARKNNEFNCPLCHQPI